MARAHSRPSSLFVLGLSGLLLCSCGRALNSKRSGAPSSETGVMDDALKPEQRARLQLIGRTSAPTRYVERTDANRIRVVAIDFGGTYIGQCADTEGNLLLSNCGPKAGAERAAAPVPVAAPAASATTTAAPPPPVDDAIHLTHGMFRQYSTQVGSTVEVSAAVGPVSADTKWYQSRNFLVLEWRRYYLQELPPSSTEQSRPLVSAIERGIAVRIIFDVRLMTADAKLTASFGIANLSTVLARNEATVEVSYEVLGTPLDPLPAKPLIITSLAEYLDAVGEFYRAVKLISVASACSDDRQCTGEGLTPSKAAGSLPTLDINYGTPRAPMQIALEPTRPEVLAYYVSGTAVGANYSLLVNVEDCEQATAQASYLRAAIRDAKRELEELDERRRPRADVLTTRRVRARIEQLQAELRALAADSAALNCKRACDAEKARLENTKSDLLGWTEDLQPDETEAETEAKQAEAAFEAAKPAADKATKAAAAARAAVDKAKADKQPAAEISRLETEATNKQRAADEANELLDSLGEQAMQAAYAATRIERELNRTQSEVKKLESGIGEFDELCKAVEFDAEPDAPTK